jgi:hypothetical protein
MSTCPTAQDQENFVRTSKFFSFYLELHKNKFKIFISRTAMVSENSEKQIESNANNSQAS